MQLIQIENLKRDIEIQSRDLKMFLFFSEKANLSKKKKYKFKLVFKIFCGHESKHQDRDRVI